MSVRRSLSWAFLGQFLAFAIQFFGSIAMARLLSPAEVGIYAISIAAIGLVQVLVTFGIVTYVVREVELTPDVLASATTVNALLVLTLSVALVAASFVAGPLLGEEKAGDVLRVIAMSNLLGIIGFRPSAMLQRNMQFKQLSIIGLSTALIQTVMSIAFALLGASYMSFAYASFLSNVVSTSLTMYAGRQYVDFTLSLSKWKPIVTFGLQMVSVSGVAAITGNLSDLLLGRLLGVTALGLYSRASNLSGTIFNNLYGTAVRVIFVQLSKDYREGGDWRRTYLRSFSMVTALMWPFLIGLAVLAGPAVLLLYGDRWLEAAAPLAALLVAQFIGVAFGMNWELFVIRGETAKQARYEVARLIFGTPLFAIGCLFSITAAGIAKICDALIGLVLYYPHVRRLAGLGPREIPDVYLSSAALTLVAVLPSVVVMGIYEWSPHAPLLAVFAGVVLGVGAWSWFIFFTGHPLRDEALLVIAKLRTSVARGPSNP